MLSLGHENRNNKMLYEKKMPYSKKYALQLYYAKENFNYMINGISVKQLCIPKIDIALLA